MNAKPAGAPAGPVEEAAAEPAASSLLGSAEFLDEVLVAVVSDVLGHPARPKDWTVLPAGYEARSISTGALLRIRGTTHEEEPWSIFVKILQSPRHWPLIDVIPPELRQGVIDTFPWRDEADVLRSDLPDRLPPGLRTPRLLRVDDLGDDRLAMWLEDITPADTPGTSNGSSGQPGCSGAGRAADAVTPPQPRCVPEPETSCASSSPALSPTWPSFV